jgi:REP element-mobilizing transposase RayT
MSRQEILDGIACFTTHVIHNHTPLFTRPAYMEIICSALQHARDLHALRIHGYVIMPDHLHLLTSLTSPEQLRDILTRFRRYTATQLLQRIKIEGVTWAVEQLALGESNLNLWTPTYKPIMLLVVIFFCRS